MNTDMPPKANTSYATERRTILLFSLEPWGPMWYSKHHYAAELAKAHEVYFISPPENWRLRHLFIRGLRLVGTPEGVTVVHYTNHLPLRLLPASLAGWTHRSTARKLSRLLRKKDDLLWCFHPTPLALEPVLRARNTRMIYHVVDPYQNFLTDGPCAVSADLVVAVNPWFVDRYKPLNPATLLIPHGTSPENRVADQRKPLHRSLRWQPYAVLAGNLNHRLGLDLLLTTFKALPGCRLVLAGPLAPLSMSLQAKRNELLALPNVTHAGMLAVDELALVMANAVAGLVAYPFEPYSEHPSMPYGSLKPLVYLEQLKPVVTTINCYLPELLGRAVHKAENTEAFIHLVDQAANGQLPLDKELTERYLAQHSYGQHVKQLFAALDGLHVKVTSSSGP
jgi:glycosyltransferase involved in cell wall biosynthesis